MSMALLLLFRLVGDGRFGRQKDGRGRTGVLNAETGDFDGIDDAEQRRMFATLGRIRNNLNDLPEDKEAKHG